MTDTISCPCLSTKAYSVCCQPLHKGDAHANSAEQLVRSRYSVFVFNHIDYLIKQNTHWFYVDGELLEDMKLSRNEPCFCGSGKKLKKCHI